MLKNNPVVASWLKRGQALPQAKFLVVTKDDQSSIQPIFTAKSAYNSLVESLYADKTEIIAVYDLEEEYASFDDQLSADKPWFTGPIQNEEENVNVIQKLIQDLEKQGASVIDTTRTAANDAVSKGSDKLDDLFSSLGAVEVKNPLELLDMFGVSKEEVAEMLGIESTSNVVTVYRVAHPGVSGNYIFTDAELADKYMRILDDATGTMADLSEVQAVIIDGDYYSIAPNPFATQEQVEEMENFTQQKIAEQSVEDRRKAALAKLSDEDKAILGLNP